MSFGWHTSYTSSWGDYVGSGTRTTFLASFLPTGGEEELTFYGFSGSGSTYIYFYQQDLEGEYSLVNTVTSSAGTFYISDKYQGYTAYQYSTNGSSWTTLGEKDSSGYYATVSGFSRLYIRYNLSQYTLTFDYNYPAATGFGNVTKSYEGITYGASLNGDEEDDSSTDYSQITPSEEEIPEHYEFQGWYEDSSGSTAFDFSTTMPAADKILYGKWTPIYYLVTIDPNGGVIDHVNYDCPEDDYYNTQEITASYYGLEGTGHNTSKSTYFSTQYGTSVGEYEVERTFVEYDGTAEEAAAEGVTVYYYVNVQHDSTWDNTWGEHADLRDALYLTPDQLTCFYNYFVAVNEWNAGYYDGQAPESLEEFMERYVQKTTSGEGYRLYQEGSAGTYELVGWYEVEEDGNLSLLPYNFANAVEGNLSLKALWRRVGSYYIAYDPVYVIEEEDGTETVINGNITAWTDPDESSSEKYNDGASTTTLQQPTGITANGEDAQEEYIFRGWRLVKVTGYDEDGRVSYEPLSSVYYEQASPFIINADYADKYGCIHMQAVYQSVNSSDRRPEVANLALNANGGYLTNEDGQELDGDAEITQQAGWSAAGTVVEDVSEGEIVYGQMQSNASVSLARVAVPEGYLDGINSHLYMAHPSNYFLLGFDEGSDYSLEGTEEPEDDLRTGEPYIPTYAADAVISLQRTDEQTLYGVWEPMVYVTFVNRTSGEVSFSLTSDSDETFDVVHEVKSLYEREKVEGSHLSLGAGESLKVVLPKGEGHTFTLSGTNTSLTQLLSVTSSFEGQQTGSTTAGLYRSSGAAYDLTDTLQSSASGVVVTFDGLDVAFFDTQGGSWSDSRTGSAYETVVGDASLLYVQDGSEGGLIYEPLTLPGAATEPSEPTREGYLFLGWTSDEEAAGCDTAGYTLPGTNEEEGINNLSVLMESFLYDFESELTEGIVLYALWGEEVSLTFHVTEEHLWQEEGESYVYTEGSSGAAYVLTLTKGERAAFPAAPLWAGSEGYRFYRWVRSSAYQEEATDLETLSGSVYSFGYPVTESLDLYTSWVEAAEVQVVVTKELGAGSGSDSDAEQESFTFTASITTTTYTGTVEGRKSGSGKHGSSYSYSPGTVSSSSAVEEQSFTLKPGESKTISLYYVDSVTQEASGGSSRSSADTSYSLFFQSLQIEEEAESSYTTTVSVDGGEASASSSASIDTLSEEPGFTEGDVSKSSDSSYSYTLAAEAAYGEGEEVPVLFTNTRTKTQVVVQKQMGEGEYLTGEESFAFTALYFDAEGNLVAPAAGSGYEVVEESEITSPSGDILSGSLASFSLGGGESVTLLGVPVGGSLWVGEEAAGYEAACASALDETLTGQESLTLEEVSSQGDTLTFVNTPRTYEVSVSNTVLPSEFGSKTKDFSYSATLWQGESQVAFPSSFREAVGEGEVENASLSSSGKTLSFTLKDGESLSLSGLPSGLVLSLSQEEVSGYTTKVGLSGSLLEGSSYSLEVEEDAQVLFENTLGSSSLTITKSVQGSSQEGESFDFKAQLFASAGATSAATLSQEVIDAALEIGATVEEDEDGQLSILSFCLEGGESLTLTGLPVGYYLQVTEEEESGYACYVNGIRTSTVTVQIQEENNSDLHFINRVGACILQLQKVSSQDGSALSGAEFSLYRMVNGSGETLYTLTSDEEGLLTYTSSGEEVRNLSLEKGTYYLKETEAPDGYFLLSEQLVISVTGDGVSYRFESQEDWSSVSSREAQDEDGEPYTQYYLTVENEPRITYSLTLSQALDSPFEADLSREFTLIVSGEKLAEGDTYQVSISSEEGESTQVLTVDEEGQLTLSLKGGESALIAGLLEGSYLVSEVLEEGFTLTAQAGGLGEELSEVTVSSVASEEDSSITLGSLSALTLSENSRVSLTQSWDTVEVTVNKVVEGGSSESSENSESFAFTASLSYEGEALLYTGGSFSQGAASFSLAGGESVALTVPRGVVCTLSEEESILEDYKVTTQGVTGDLSSETSALTDLDTENAQIFSFEVGEEGGEVTFTNQELDKTYQLRVVLGTSGMTSSDAQQEFLFTLISPVLLAGEEVGLALTKSGEETATESVITLGSTGSLSFTLESGDEAVLSSLPEGSYQLTQEAEGYLQTYTVMVDEEGFSDEEGESASEEVTSYGSASFTLSANTLVTVDNLLPACKITDGDGSLLMVGERPAVYATLEEGFAAFSKGGFTLEGSSLEAEAACIKLLSSEVSLSSSSGILLPEGEMTLTGAGAEDASFPYRGGETTPVVSRGSSSTTLLRIEEEDSALTLSGVIIDGGAVYEERRGTGANSGVSVASDGGLLYVSAGTLILENGTILQNSETSGKGGAVYLSGSGRMDMRGGQVLSCQAAAGAGLYVEQGAALTLSGSPSFGGTDVDEEGNLLAGEGNYCSASGYAQKYNGGALYPADEGAKDSSSGLVRQDIFLAGAAEEGQALTSLTLSSNLTGSAGSIWVWAEGETDGNNHYTLGAQFATLGFTEEVTEVTYQVFRNARSDEDSLCTGVYLSGKEGEALEVPSIYWGTSSQEGLSFSFLKVDGFGEGLAGATFTLYTDQECLLPYEKDGEALSAVSFQGEETQEEAGEAQDAEESEEETQIEETGLIVFENLSYGEYYLKESQAPEGFELDETVYKVVLSEDGSFVIYRVEESDSAEEESDSEEELTQALMEDGVYHLFNKSSCTRRVILRKVNESLESLSGAVFYLYGRDLCQAEEAFSTDEEGNTLRTLTSLESGVLYAGELSYGIYYLVETQVPEGYEENLGQVYQMRVEEEGVTTQKLFQAEGSEEEEILASFLEGVRETWE